jgi:hypothetical protein
MFGRKQAVRLASVSVLALVAGVAFNPTTASACTAEPTINGGVVTSVTVTCTAGDTASPFATSFGPWIIDGTPFTYDGNGADTFTMSGGTIASTGGFFPPFYPPDQNFRLDASTGVIEMLDGNDTVTLSGGTIGSANDVISLSLGGGADVFQMSGGSISGSVFGLGGGNTYTMSGGTIGGSIFAGSQNDSVSISGTALIQGTNADPDAVGLEDGDDTFTMSGGTVNGAVSGGNGNDVLTVGGGTIAGFVAGNDGTDEITVSGGTIAGNVSAETVRLTGGTIGGDITGITGNTLIIDDSLSPAALNLRNGVLFSGTSAVGTITNTDLAAGGTRTQNFTGFTSVTVQNSTLGFGAGSTIGIGTLGLGTGSTLFVNGPAQLTGTLVATGSTISLVDGAADDVFTLGGLALNGATIGIDVDQQAITADQLVANTFAADGTNTIIINLLGTPNFAGATDIPVILATNDPVTGTFVVQGAPATPGALFAFELVQGAGGGLLLRATPVSADLATATANAIDVASVDNALDTLDGINDEAADWGLGLSKGSMVQLTPTFGVFASGQFAKVEHDGFEVSNDAFIGTGPSFDANDFSAAISFDFNAAKHFGFDDKYGLNIGVFGGYASTDVDLGSFLSFDSVGEGTNEAGMFGVYTLFRQGLNYGLVSATTFIGQTDIVNNVLGTSGDYDTEGYAVTASAGHIFALGERARFDLRGGILGVTFEGGDYVDSGGNVFGKSRISFGALKFEPGIYADYQMENGMVFSPYARADIQQRFGYENTTDIAGTEFEFDDSDFSGAISTGFNLRMTESATLSAEVRGKASSDSTTVAGKIGLKIGF